MKKLLGLVFLALTCVAPVANAETWCTYQSGFNITTHGLQSNKVWINGVFEGETNNRWVELANETSGRLAHY